MDCCSQKGTGTKGLKKCPDEEGIETVSFGAVSGIGT